MTPHYTLGGRGGDMYYTRSKPQPNLSLTHFHRYPIGHSYFLLSSVVYPLVLSDTFLLLSLHFSLLPFTLPETGCHQPAYGA